MSTPIKPGEKRLIPFGIYPLFQSIVHRGCNTLYAVEALLRQSSSSTGCQSLIHEWENTGEIIEIDILMLQQVAIAIHRAHQHRPPRVSVNVSTLTIALIPDRYLDELEQLKAVATSVIVEITETYPINDMDALGYFARRCSVLGIKIALDDCTPQHLFTSPGFINWLKPDIIKVDGPLIARCFANHNNRPVTEIINLANSINALVIAEHIESKEMAEWVSKIGADCLQGYHFSTPRPLTWHRQANPVD